MIVNDKTRVFSGVTSYNDYIALHRAEVSCSCLLAPNNSVMTSLMEGEYDKEVSKSADRPDSMDYLCHHCNFQNLEGMRFCGNCGSLLVDIDSPSALPEGPGTPDGSAPPAASSGDLSAALPVLAGANLAERLRSAGISAAGQRRNVTILFAELCGYTDLMAKLSPQELADVVQQFMRLLSSSVYKYEGIVDKVTEVELMALFGAPITHENNAERAVRAAFDMRAQVGQLQRDVQQQSGVSINIRIGLHSGWVIAGSVGSDLRMDYTVVGDAVNIAHRILEAARPGQVLVSESVYHSTRPLFDFDPLPVLKAKGMDRPLRAYDALQGKQAPGQVRGVDGLHAPMIGRDAELAWLKRTLNAVIHEKLGRLVFITGEAGLGKSRLTREFKATLGRYPIRTLEGQSLTYRRSVAYWIFRELLCDYLEVNTETPVELVRERLTQAVQSLLGKQAADALPYLEYLLSIPSAHPAAADRLRYLDPEQLRKRVFVAVRDLLVAEAQHAPLLLILEDLHWADHISLELLLFLVESLKNSPILFLCVSRTILPGTMTRIVERANAVLGERSRVIELQSLSPNQSEQLLYQLLSVSDLPEELRAQILDRAAGIPFYLEEILRMLIDEGAIQYVDGQWHFSKGVDLNQLKVPDMLRELILARFDRLSPIQRSVLQVAAVIGKDFSTPVLEAVLQPSDPSKIRAALDRLTERQFIEPKKGTHEKEYSFRHILMSDAIYATLLRRERSRIHGQVGAAIEALYPGRIEENIELLAYHYRWSPHLDRALHYLILAGEKSARSNIHEMARQHFEAALEILPRVQHTPEQYMRVRVGMGDALQVSGDYPAARQNYASALDVIKPGSKAASPENRSLLLRKLARTFERQGKHPEALNYLDQAQQELAGGESSFPVELAQIWSDIGMIHYRCSRFVEAGQYLQNALNLVVNSEAYDVVASIYNRLAGLGYHEGDWDRAAGFLRKSIAIRESIRDLSGLASSFNNLGCLEIEIGEFDSALANLTRSYEINVRMGQAEGIAAALANLGWLHTLRGDIDKAKETLTEALELSQQIGYSSLERLILKNFGELYLAARDWDRAIEALRQFLEQVSAIGAKDQLLDTYRLLGEAALGKGDLEAAAGWAQKAEQWVASLENEVSELSAVQRGELRRFLGMLAAQQKDWDAAKAHLQASETIFQKLKSRLYQGRVAFQFGVLAEAQGQRLTAQLRFREAALLFQSVGARLEQKRAEDARGRQTGPFALGVRY